MNVLNQAQGDTWVVYHGDSCEVLKGIPDDSIHYSITSIPFASLYTYSNSDRDFGNSRNYQEFAEQYRFLSAEWFRIMMPGSGSMKMPKISSSTFTASKNMMGESSQLMISCDRNCGIPSTVKIQANG